MVMDRTLLEHFPEKWRPVFRRKCDQLKKLERVRFNLIETRSREHQAEPDLQAPAVTAHGSGRESGATEIWCDWSRNQPRARFGASGLDRAPPMAATPRGNDFSQDGDGDLIRGDGSEIEAGRRLEFREPRGAMPLSASFDLREAAFLRLPTNAT